MKQRGKRASTSDIVQQPEVEAAAPSVAERCIFLALEQIGAFARWTPKGDNQWPGGSLALWGSLDDTGVNIDVSDQLRFTCAGERAVNAKTAIAYTKMSLVLGGKPSGVACAADPFIVSNRAYLAGQCGGTPPRPSTLRMRL